MKLSDQKPPNWDKLTEHFPVTWGMGVIVTYGDTIHCKHDISFLKQMHELIHVQQQAAKGVKEWWEEYYASPAFRLSQEIEAYRNEIAHAKRVIKDRNQRHRYLHQICIDISSSMYGNMVSFNQAMNLLGK